MAEQYDQESFVEKSKELFPEKLTYEKTVYKGMDENLILTCKEHGDFEKKPFHHIKKKRGCPKCSQHRGKSKRDINWAVNKSKEVHGDRYDYSKSEFVNMRTKAIIICKDHGEFTQSFNKHINSKQGCPKCANKITKAKKTPKEIVDKCTSVHEGKYQYFEDEIQDCNSVMRIICPEHGQFFQSVVSHSAGRGCRDCGYKRVAEYATKWDEHSFFGQCAKVHDDKYKYFEFKDCDTKMKISCPEHGIFYQNPRSHLSGKGCQKCGFEKISQSKIKTNDEFIEEALIVHEGYYKYPRTDYKNSKTPVCITCPEHGDFWQRPNCHLMGKGCSSCSNSKMESQISDYLIKNSIDFEEQKKFDSCVDKDKLRFDVYIPSLNLLLEAQGVQHFEKVEFFGGKKAFEEQQKRDKIKKDWADKSKYTLRYINYFDDIEQKLQDILTEQKALKEIREFLEENEIDFTQNDDRFTFGNYHIQYVIAKDFPVNSPKQNISGVSKDYFLKQSEAAENNNEFICFVRDYEWQDDRKREVLKSYWLYASGKLKNKFYARDCEVRLVGTKEGVEFEENHCFYGKRPASLRLGLYSKKEKHGVPKDTLLMIYTFGRNHFGGKDQIEVLRVGTLKNFQVIGGASKLLKYFFRNYKTLTIGGKEYSADNLVFYCDKCHNKSNSMEKLGFEYLTRTPGFMNLWLETGEVKHRQPAKHKLIMEEMKNGNVLPIPLVGTKTYNLKITDQMRI